MNQDYIHLRSALAQRYSEGEARAIAFLLFEEAFGVSRTDIYADKVRQFSEDEAQRLHLMCNELLQGIPVQYVLGHALFVVIVSTLRLMYSFLVPKLKS